MPPELEVGATKARFGAAYQLEGIDDIGVEGIKWAGIGIAETEKTDQEGFEFVAGGGGRDLRLAIVGFRNSLANANDGIRSWNEDLKKGTPEEKTSAKTMLAKEIKLRDSAQRALEVSGKAELHGPEKEFVFRRGSQFLSGYLDSFDSRVRTFEGGISSSELAGALAATADYRQLRNLYKARRPEDIPSGPGFCTAFGFLSEPIHPELNTRIELPFRSSKYPNLIFVLSIEPALASSGANIQLEPNMNADKAKLDSVGVKRKHGPEAVSILNTPGRMVSQEYQLKVCANGGCRPSDQAYDFEAETYGTSGDVSKPHLTLNMRADFSDDYKSKLVAIPGNEGALTVRRTSLSGHVPPSYEEGRKIFEQVLHSIRLRPGAVAHMP